MRKYFDVVFYTTSIPVAGALVFVTDSSGDLVPLFSDDGVTPTANPTVTDSTGFYSFYVADGVYDLQHMMNGVTLRTIADVQIYDLSIAAGNITNSAMIAWFYSLPTTLPSTAGQPWNNDGEIAFS